MRTVLITLKFIFVDLIGDFIYWPVWWYTAGFYDRLLVAKKQIKELWRALSIGIWLRYFFTPMYGDYSFSGRLISLFARLFVLIWKLFWFFLWSIIVLFMIVFWLISLPLAIYMISCHFK